MKHGLRRITALLVMISVMILPSFAPAEESPQGDFGILADDFFNSYSISMTDHTSYIHISFSVTAKQTSDVLGAPSYDVQRKVDGSWVTIASNLTGKTGSDTAAYSFSKNYTCVPGYDYRVRAHYYCKKYDGTSKTVTYVSTSISM